VWVGVRRYAPQSHGTFDVDAAVPPLAHWPSRECGAAVAVQPQHTSRHSVLRASDGVEIVDVRVWGGGGVGWWLEPRRGTSSGMTHESMRERGVPPRSRPCPAVRVLTFQNTGRCASGMPCEHGRRTSSREGDSCQAKQPGHRADSQQRWDLGAGPTGAREWEGPAAVVPDTNYRGA
jgi:hypothetical protein